MRPGEWRRSSFSGDWGNGGSTCVEVAVLSCGRVGVRDSKRPGAGHLTFTGAEMTAWIGAVKAGEFDLRR